MLSGAHYELLMAVIGIAMYRASTALAGLVSYVTVTSIETAMPIRSVAVLVTGTLFASILTTSKYRDAAI